MRILLVNPPIPETFWSFRHAIKFVSKRAVFPPLGLLTVASMLPASWTKRVVDMNTTALSDSDIVWADLVFVGAMSVQESSARSVIARAQRLHRTVVAGGPLFSARPDEFAHVDHLVLNEAEITLPSFLKDLASGVPQRICRTSDWADITTTPVPSWDLITMKHYSNMNVQYSRGCPFDCEFCDITVLFGRRPRTKSVEQLLKEFDALADRGWSDEVFLVDDNFIGNRTKLKNEILPAMIHWRRGRKQPFLLNTEASLDLADDRELMQMMVEAGFTTVFVGIESPHEESLAECRKAPNRKRNLLSSVRSLQTHGLQVQGGFILGFDSDPATIFHRMVEFIQESGIVTAMVGLLNAPVGTRLYRRLRDEGRLLTTMSGDNTDFSMNFVPKMNLDALVQGYRQVLESIYAPKQYYQRVRTFLRTYQPGPSGPMRLSRVHLQAFVKSIVILGIIGKERVEYWRLFFWSLFTHPKTFPMAITLSIYGFHYRKVLEHYGTL
ncbi:MAG: DUF4070 domain-containing protein [Bacteroidetes bacterium]|jgi:radical SAM superfamily enzyme YgiQ (UPF0313 family)|nr:DUF4070 domain-containing protein [Bacteroidota bacterium]